MSTVVGERFPAQRLRSATGSVDLAALWQRGPVVVAFHRMWCPFCQQAAVELSRLAPRLASVGGHAVIVYREDTEEVACACTERHTQAICVSDADRTLERAVDLPDITVGSYGLFNPLRLVVALRTGARVRTPRHGILQGRATFVVAAGGTVVYVHRATTAADIPSVSDLAAAIDQAVGTPA